MTKSRLELSYNEQLQSIDCIFLSAWKSLTFISQSLEKFSVCKSFASQV